MPDTAAPNPSQRPDAAGVFGLRVRYCECDPMGVAHHAAYIPWLEEARTELLRTSGVSFAQIEATGVYLAVIKLDAAYKRPARYDDLVEVQVRVIGGSRVKIHHAYEVRLVERPGLAGTELAAVCGAGHDLLVAASTTLACLDGQGRPGPAEGATELAGSSGVTRRKRRESDHPGRARPLRVGQRERPGVSARASNGQLISRQGRDQIIDRQPTDRGSTGSPVCR